VAQIKPGAEVPVTIVRDGKTMDVAVKIGTMPANPKMANNQTETGKTGHSLSSLGIQVAPAEDGAGVKITAVDPNGPAADKGLKEGDIILEVAGQEVHNPADIRSALKAAGGKKQVLMLVRTGDGQRFLALPVGQG
jgi:serine protease Do